MSFFSRRQADTNNLAACPFEILPYDEPAAEAYGDIRVKLEKSGLSIGPFDMLIAAQALSRNLVLVTNNEMEFKRVESLKVENWT